MDPLNAMIELWVGIAQLHFETSMRSRDKLERRSAAKLDEQATHIVGALRRYKVLLDNA